MKETFDFPFEDQYRKETKKDPTLLIDEEGFYSTHYVEWLKKKLEKTLNTLKNYKGGI